MTRTIQVEGRKVRSSPGRDGEKSALRQLGRFKKGKICTENHHTCWTLPLEAQSADSFKALGQPKEVNKLPWLDVSDPRKLCCGSVVEVQTPAKQRNKLTSELSIR